MRLVPHEGIWLSLHDDPVNDFHYAKSFLTVIERAHEADDTRLSAEVGCTHKDRARVLAGLVLQHAGLNMPLKNRLEDFGPEKDEIVIIRGDEVTVLRDMITQVGYPQTYERPDPAVLLQKFVETPLRRVA